MSDLRRRALIAQGGHAPPTNPSISRAPPVSTKREIPTLQWPDFFDEKRDLTIGEDIFRVYIAGMEFIDGTGPSEGPLIYCLHGGGNSALSFGFLARELKKLGTCVISYDFRGHGHTQCQDSGDLSANTLTMDTVAVHKALFPEKQPPTVLVGHSLGGTIATKTCKSIPGAEGLVVLDVVEGTAMASLPSMHTVLDRRPTAFRTVSAAIEWCVRSQTVKYLESASLSMPDIIHNKGTDDEPVWTWVTDLAASEQYWSGWFDGLSAAFLAAPAAKLLILAGTDRLDKPLTIGQMEGKYQLQIIYNAGHYIHEDLPDKVAASLYEFSKRNGIGFESALQRILREKEEKKLRS